MIKRLLLAATIAALLPIGAHAQSTAPQCEGQTQTWTLINKAAATRTLLVAGTAGKFTYVCKLYYRTGIGNIALVEGTGATCGTNTLGILGGPAAATGQVFSAEGELNLPADSVPWARTTVAGNSICIDNSSTAQVSGVVITTKLP